MALSARLAQVFLHSLFLILLTQAPRQNAAPGLQVSRIQLSQDQLSCFAIKITNPIYPRAARLAHTEGVVKFIMIIAADGSVGELQAVSGDPVLLDSAMEAVRQWRFAMAVRGDDGPREAEVPLSFTFKIEDPPKPAYLHLSNGEVIRADEVREFTDRIEYIADHRTHYISPDRVTEINACAGFSNRIPRKEGGCVPGGGPSFVIRGIPLLPSVNASRTYAPSLN
jgi:TonB family protein